MHDGPVRSDAGDGGKRDILKEPGIAAEANQRLDGVDFGQLAARRFAVEPGEKTHHRCAITQLRRMRAGDLGGILYRLHRRDRIGRAHDFTAALGHRARYGIGA